MNYGFCIPDNKYDYLEVPIHPTVQSEVRIQGADKIVSAMIMSDGEIAQKLPSKQIKLKCSKLDATLTAYLRAYLLATFDLPSYFKVNKPFKITEPSILELELQTLTAYSCFLARVKQLKITEPSSPRNDMIRVWH